jgi:hypothetical protein
MGVLYEGIEVIRMPNLPKLEKMGFWSLLGMILGVDIGLTFLYTLFVPGFTISAWSDALCGSAFLLALGSVIPVFLDAGRGFGISGKMGGSKSEQHKALTHERSLREKGMKITFALALATLLTGLLSMILSVL